jgi:hypothetical protein
MFNAVVTNGATIAIKVRPIATTIKSSSAENPSWRRFCIIFRIDLELQVSLRLRSQH